LIVHLLADRWTRRAFIRLWRVAHNVVIIKNTPIIIQVKSGLEQPAPNFLDTYGTFRLSPTSTQRKTQILLPTSPLIQ
jgi:hypothetical protein